MLHQAAMPVVLSLEGSKSSSGSCLHQLDQNSATEDKELLKAVLSALKLYTVLNNAECQAKTGGWVNTTRMIPFKWQKYAHRVKDDDGSIV